MTKRKQYSKEFKLDAVSLVTEQGYTQLEAAKGLEINANMLSRWVRKLSDTDGQAFRGNGKLTPDQEENKRLRAAIKRLEMERDILKKSDGLLCKRNEIKYSFITEHKKTSPVSVMCRLLDVSRNGYYSYQKRHLDKPDDPDMKK